MLRHESDAERELRFQTEQDVRTLVEAKKIMQSAERMALVKKFLEEAQEAAKG